MIEFSSKKYSVILCDPPWSYGNFQGKGKKYGDVSAHYPTMSHKEICALPIMWRCTAHRIIRKTESRKMGQLGKSSIIG
jgi:N6-adenosine-specific RNA methylase IME4